MSLVKRVKNHWRRYQFEKPLKRKQKQFDDIFWDNQAALLSKKEREVKDALSLTYGEIDFMSFCALLSLIKPTQNDIFYDLGCGAGKACVAALLAYDVKESHGIELLESIRLEANRLKEKLPTAIKDSYFLHPSNFLQYDLRRATIIFINATGFFGKEWQQVIEHLIASTTPGARLLISSKKLPDSHFILTHTTPCLMDFGPVTVYIYKKK